MRHEKRMSVERGETDGPPCFFFSGLRRNLTSCGCVTVSGTLSESLLRSTSHGGRCISGCTTSARSGWGCSPRTFPPPTPTSQKVAEAFGSKWTEFCFISIMNHEVSRVLVFFSQSAVFVLAGRQVKMAFVNSVAKPPRDVRRRQEKFGTTSASSAASTAAAAPIKSVLCCLYIDNSIIIWYNYDYLK